MRTIELVIFDMDGTLVDSEGICRDVWHDIWSRLGYQFSPDYYQTLLGHNDSLLKAKFQRDFSPDFPFEQCMAERDSRILAELERRGGAPRPGLYPLFSYLKLRGIKTALGTASQRDRAVRSMELLGILDQLDAICCGPDVAKGKPAPDLFLRAASLARVSPEHAMVVEDSQAGILAAHRAGMYPVMIPDMAPPTPETKRLAAYQLRTLDELIPVIEDLNSESSASHTV